jgi:hypothetical protein
VNMHYFIYLVLHESMDQDLFTWVGSYKETYLLEYLTSLVLVLLWELLNRRPMVLYFVSTTAILSY